MFSCPRCRRSLERMGRNPVPCLCGEVYPILVSGGVDFLQGKEFPDFHLDAGDPEAQKLLDQEADGVSWRMEGFVVPLILRRSRFASRKPQDIEVLDVGCGSGMSVETLQVHGIPASGIDAGKSRHEQWRNLPCSGRLHSADALHLPFRDGCFDVVLSSGLVEHIGIHEEISSGYRSKRLSDCHTRREQFVREMVRVLKPEGFILLDHPNGAFPADFWHGSEAGAIRWHSISNDMLPRYSEITRYFRAADPTIRLLSISPIHRLRFRQVGRHWYGRILTPVAGAWLRLLDVPGLSKLAGSFLNPYLVTLACRLPGEWEWVRPRSEEH